MRNLKRVLALALALVMTLGVLVMGSSAASYTDASQIDAKYDEAVEVLTNIGVFQGMEGNAFSPNTILTRAQASALVYRILTGDVTDAKVDLYDYKSFNDVPAGKWFTGYVTYAANGGYIKGWQGNFDPDAQVTGVQVLAIMLRAIGYGQNGEFEGAAWKDNTLTTAQDLGLLANVDIKSLDNGAPRQLVAQLLFNAITKANIVYYTPALGYYTNDMLNGLADTTLGYKVFKLVKTTGEITGTVYQKGITELSKVVYSNSDSKWTTQNTVSVINTDGNWENIGYAAYVWTVPTPGAKTRTAVSDVTVTGKSLLVSTDGTPYGDLDDDQITPDTDIHYYYNGVLQTTTADINAAKALVDNTGVKVDFIDNDNGGKIEAVVITEYTTAQVSGIALDTNTGINAVTKDTYYFSKITNGGLDTTATRHAVAKSDLVCDTALSYGDIVTYVEYRDDTYVTVAPITTGAFTKITYGSVNQRDQVIYTIGGNGYVLVANKYWAGNKALLSTANAAVKKSLSVYTDPYGYALRVAEPVIAKDYMFVMWNNETQTSTRLAQAEVAYTNGTVSRDASIAGTTNVTGISGNKWHYIQNELASSAIITGKTQSGIYTYAADATSNYVLTAVGTAFTTGTLRNGAVNVTLGGKSLTVTNKTIVVDLRAYLKGTAQSGTVYTGWTEMPDVNSAKGAYVQGANGSLEVVFLTDGNDAATASFLVYTTQQLNDYEAGVFTIPVAKNGTATTQTLTGTEYNQVQQLQNGVYSYDLNGNLKYTAFPEVWENITWRNGAIYTLTKQADGTYKTEGYLHYNDDTTLTVLDITNGTCEQYGMVFGTDRGQYVPEFVENQIVKAYIEYTPNNSTAKHIYLIVGIEAGTAPADPTKPAAVYTFAKNVFTADPYDLWTKTGVTVNNVTGSYTYKAAVGYITSPVFAADDIYTVNNVLTYRVNSIAKVDAPAGAEAVQYTYTLGGTPYTKYAPVKDGVASFIMPAANVTTSNDAYYAFVLDGVTYYTTAGNKTATQLITEAQAQGYTAPTGTYYKYTWDVTNATGDEGELIVSTTDAADSSKGYLNAATYDVAEVTTGYFKVDVTGTASAKDHKVVAGELLNVDGTVAYNVGDSITTAGTYYAKAGTHVATGAATAADSHWTVDKADVTIALT